MRQPARLGPADANQAAIVADLEAVGVRVVSATSIGAGFPDLIAAYRGKLFLFEVKTATGKLNPAQRDFHAAWPAPIHVIRSSTDALSIVLERNY